MVMHVTTQVDLFDPVEPEMGSAVMAGTGIASFPPLAIPCGFRSRRNAPCRWLGTRSVTIDGAPLHHRDWRLVHCDLACFQGGDAERGDSEAVGNR